MRRVATEGVRVPEGPTIGRKRPSPSSRPVGTNSATGSLIHPITPARKATGKPLRGRGRPYGTVQKRAVHFLPIVGPDGTCSPPLQRLGYLAITLTSDRLRNSCYSLSTLFERVCDAGISTGHLSKITPSRRSAGKVQVNSSTTGRAPSAVGSHSCLSSFTGVVGST
jgi:hypothetical protein